MRAHPWLLIPVLSAVAATALATTNLKKTEARHDQMERALARLTFGVRQQDVEEVERTGLKRWIQQQLHPDQIAEDPGLQQRLSSLSTLTLSNADLLRQYPRKLQIDGAEKEAITPEARKRFVEFSVEDQRAQLQQRAPVRLVNYDLEAAKLDRAINSRRQLEEVLVDFWYNHFNVHINKAEDRWLVTSFERDAIRPHVLGKFEDLLVATAKSPAMLFYLDNWLSSDPNAEPVFPRLAAKKNQRRGLNENYARELMELHTLGVNGGYSQKDVIEVARCFTGWTIERPRQVAEFRFAPKMHDPGEKHVLGMKIAAGGGMDDGMKVLHLLAHHPATAHFISTELAQRFVSDTPPKALVDRMAKEFLKTGGDLRAVMAKMIDSPEFWNAGPDYNKFKSPLEYVASALRTTNAQITSPFILGQTLQKMGQPLYQKLEPNGYPNDSRAWMNSNALVERMNFAVALSRNRLPGIRVSTDDPQQLASQLGSPEFQQR